MSTPGTWSRELEVQLSAVWADDWREGALSLKSLPLPPKVTFAPGRPGSHNPPTLRCMAVRFSPWLSLVAGSVLAMTGLPSAFSVLTLVPLTLLFWHLTRPSAPRQLAVQTWWAITAYFTVQLSWLVAFMHALMVEGGLPAPVAWPLAAVGMFPLFALEGAFWALMAWGVARAFHTPQARLWGLAGG